MATETTEDTEGKYSVLSVYSVAEKSYLKKYTIKKAHSIFLVKSAYPQILPPRTPRTQRH